ncbi:hypothetical protein TNCV_4358461 [Trichonephila clavipes]|nr:hypothetical protein TNCV_4358461 [Trichonephila clavipes]
MARDIHGHYIQSPGDLLPTPLTEQKSCADSVGILVSINSVPFPQCLSKARKKKASPRVVSLLSKNGIRRISFRNEIPPENAR